MGLVEDVMSKRSELSEFKYENLGFEASKEFKDLVSKYNITAEFVKGANFEKSIEMVKTKMEEVRNAANGFTLSIQQVLLELLDRYQKGLSGEKATKVILDEMISETKQSIANTETKLKNLKVGKPLKDSEGNTIKDEEGKEVTASKADKKELEVFLKDTKKELVDMEKHKKKLEAELPKLEEEARKVGVVSDEGLANMIHNEKGTGLVNSLMRVRDFISSAKKNKKEPKKKEVDKMWKELTDEKQKGSYTEIYTMLCKMSEMKITPPKIIIDFTVMKNDIKGVLANLKNSLQTNIENKSFTMKDIKKIKADTKKSIQTIMDNCDAYCKVKGNKDLINLSKFICGFTELCEATDAFKDMPSGGGGSNTTAWIFIGLGIVLVVAAFVFGGLCDAGVIVVLDIFVETGAGIYTTTAMGIIGGCILGAIASFGIGTCLF